LAKIQKPPRRLLLLLEASQDHFLVTPPYHFTPQTVRGWVGGYCIGSMGNRVLKYSQCAQRGQCRTVSDRARMSGVFASILFSKMVTYWTYTLAKMLYQRMQENEDPNEEASELKKLKRRDSRRVIFLIRIYT
jgi:hypothetical protein